MDWLLHHFKYQGRLDLGRLLGVILADHLMELAAQGTALPDLLLPTPLHPNRLRARGFNQALELGHELQRRLDLPLERSILRRTRATLSQTGLKPRERRRNIRGAFTVTGDVAGLRVAVLDDVLTTGSTAAEMSRTLLRAGASEVVIWTVARAGKG